VALLIANVGVEAVVRWVIPSPDARPDTEGTKAAMTDDSRSRDHAVEQLQMARERRERCSQHYDAARGSAGELRAFTELQAAVDTFAAREAWLAWADRDY
jgi:hypothetical protein